jgi:hypothetical protein
MSKMTPFRLTLCASLVGVGALVAAGCTPEGGCTYDSCAPDEYCNAEQVCTPNEVVDLPGGGGGPINPVGDAGDPGTNPGDRDLRTDFPVAWLEEDEANPGRLFYPDFNESGGVVAVDRVRAFAGDDGAEELGDVLDTLVMIDGSCQPDTIHWAPTPDEIWLDCTSAPNYRIVYDGNPVAQTQNTAGVRAQVVYRTDTPANLSDYARHLVAPRGGALRSLQMRDEDQLGSDRFEDTFQTLSFSNVVAIFRIAPDGLDGDHVLVHDRGTNQLIPMTRDGGAELWRPHAELQVRDLPADTHAVWLIDDVSATGNTQTSNVANYLTIEPGNGVVRYWNYEVGQEILPLTTYESNPSFRGAPPAATERLLLEETPSGNYLMYAQKDRAKIWRIPFAPGDENNVRQHLLNDTDLQPSGIVPVSDTEAWVSFGNENLIRRLTLDRGL